MEVSTAFSWAAARWLLPEAYYKSINNALGNSIQPCYVPFARNDFAAQFQCVFDNLGDVLQGLGAGWHDVAKFTTYMLHSQDLEQFMALRAALFPKLFGGDVFPPNTLLMVDRLVKEEFLIEVEAVVAAPAT